eukprot:gene2389-2141_t
MMYFLAILGGLVATGTADSDAVRFDGSPQAKLVDFLHHHETAYVPLPTNVPRDTTTLTLSSHGQEFTLELAPDRGLLAPGATAEYHGPNGVEKIVLEMHRFHVGRVVGQPDSYARVHFRHDNAIDGIIRTDENVQYHIEPATRYSELAADAAVNQSHNHVVFKASNINDDAVRGAGRTYGTAEELFPMDSGTLSAEFRLRGRRGAGGEEGSVNGQGASTDCRSNSGKCSCTVALQADYTFMASSFGEGSANVAAQYMVNQLAVADQNFRRTVLNNYM